jgi:hypothetical protein
MDKKKAKHKSFRRLHIALLFLHKRILVIYWKAKCFLCKFWCPANGIN